MRIETTPGGLLVTLAPGDYVVTWELDDYPGLAIYANAAGRPVQVRVTSLSELRRWIDAELGGRLDADTLARRYRLPAE